MSKRIEKIKASRVVVGKETGSFETDGLVFEEFYQQNHTIAFYFFGIVFFLLLSGLYMEYLRSNWVLFYLDLTSLVFCVSALAVLRFFSGTGILKRITVTFLLLAMVLLEVETQFYDNNAKFFEIEMWIINPILLLLIAFFFSGRPKYYFVFSSVVFFYFVFRTSREGMQYFGTRETWISIADMAALQLFCFFLNVWWFGYRTETIRKTEKLTRQLRLERESMSRNLHDYLGAKATDLSLLVKSIQNRDLGDMESVIKLRRLSEEIFQGVREITANVEDAKLISEDVWSGIRVLLLRRYGDGGRKVKFSRIGEADYYSDSDPAAQLLGIVTEICSNDLKYGSGISHWSFKPGKESVKILVRSRSLYTEPRLGSLGHKTIRDRASILGGDWNENLIQGRFQGELEIPVERFRRIEFT